MSKVTIVAGLACIFVLAGCDKGVDSPRGFSLPTGDSERGKQVFVNNSCLSCHSVDGLNDDNVAREHMPPIKLGASSAVVKTYAQLVTSIINPSHRISKGAYWATSDENGESIMRNYNDVLTVSDLINVVAYLQPHYKVSPLRITPYRSYPALPEEPLKKP